MDQLINRRIRLGGVKKTSPVNNSSMDVSPQDWCRRKAVCSQYIISDRKVSKIKLPAEPMMREELFNQPMMREELFNQPIMQEELFNQPIHDVKGEN